MAKNTSGAVHLTSLDLDISKISEQLNTIKDEVNLTAEDIPRLWNSGIESGGTIDILEKLGINDIPAAEEKIKSLIDALGSYQKLELQAKGGELFKAIATQADESGIAIRKVIDLTKDLNDALSSASVIDTSPAVISKRTKKEEEEYYNASIQYRRNLSKEEQNATKIALEESGKRNQAREKELEAIKKLDEQSYSSTLKNQEDYILSMEKSVLSLSSAYERLGEKVKSIDIPDEMKQKFTSNIQTVLDKLATMQSDISLSQVVPEGFEQQLKIVQKVFDGLSKSIESTRLEQEKFKKDTKEAYDSIKTGIRSAVSDLKVLEKSATFTSSRKEAALLRSEFERLYDEIKNGNIDLKTAESNFSSLETRLDNFKTTVHTGTTAFQNFANKISESAKWQIANKLLDTFQQSLGNVLGTITDTEDAVIELRRVLSDAPLAAGISDELYQIAYDFGQTFENVQEVAVRFAQTGMDWTEVVDATRATMLGLNTAELEVTSATEGLIAVMAQFHIDAEDLEGVIDKINTTADHFPVTSEKIVAALQRAGGTASAFGLSLEETIGIITALSEATGRAGEAIGTAMNSLISFSMKDTALEKFSEFLGKDVSDYKVLDLWQELSAAIKNGNTELATMMSQSEEFSDLMDETLASSVGLEEEYNLALKEGNDTLKEGKNIYSTVGTYRQNYFIALLNNIGTATEAIDGMGDALGYSLRENETAMSTFTKQWNQLVVSARELAIQFGEAGFLDLVKQLADAGTAALKLTKSVGGLNTVILAFSTLMLGIKRQKINEYFESTNTVVSKSIKIFSIYSDAVDAGETRIKAFTIALKSIELSAGGVITLIAGIGTAIYGAVSAFKQAEKEAAELREELIQTGKEASEASKQLADSFFSFQAKTGGGMAKEVVSEYTKALEEISDEQSASAIRSVSDAFADVKQYADEAGFSVEEYAKKVKDGSLKTKENMVDSSLAILEQFGYQKEDIPLLTERYENLENAVRALTESQYELQKLEAADAYKASIESIKDIELSVKDFDFGNLDEQMYKVSSMFNILPKSLSEAKEQLSIYRAEFDRYGGTLDNNQKKTDKYYLTLDKLIKGLQEYVTDVEDAEYRLNLFGDSIDDYIKNLRDANAAADEALGNVDNAVSGLSNVAVSIDDLNTSIEALQKQFDILSGKVDGFQSAYSTVQKVIEEYNETGILTADMLQTIMGLEPEYIEMLNVEGESISLNEEKVRELMQTNEDYLVQLEALRVAEQIQTMIRDIGTNSTANMTEAQIKQRIATQELSGTLEKAVLSFIKGETTADDLQKAIRNIASSSGLAGNQLNVLGTAVDSLTGKMIAFNNVARITRLENTSTLERRPGESDEAYQVRVDALNRYRQQQKIQQDIKDSQKFWASSGASASKKSSGGTSSTKKETDELKEQKESLDDLIDSYEHQIFLLERQGDKQMEIVDIYKQAQEAIHEQAEAYRSIGTKEALKYADELSELWWDYKDKIDEILNGIYEATVESHENAIRLLSEQFDYYENRNDYAKMSQNLQKQLEYQKKIQEEAHKEAERLRKLDVDENSEAIQSLISTWWKADDAIQEINKRIEESVLNTYDDFIDLADEFDLWKYMDFTKVDYLKVKLDDINKLLKDGTISLKEYNSLLRQWNVDMFNAQKQLIQQQQEDIKKRSDEVVNGYEAEIKALEKRKDDVESYYDGVVKGYEEEIDALEKRKKETEDYYDGLIDSLNEVQEANDRINAQIDYYNARQKILTNLEQAQARSGVAWREKEMEYQQQLIDLDEDWNRTQEGWKIEDQIDQLQKLKEQATADIDATIEKAQQSIEAAEEASKAAVDAIDHEIAGIQDTITAVEEQAELEIQALEDQITNLSQQFAEAIKAGMSDGLIDSKGEFDKAVVDGRDFLLSTIEESAPAIQESAEQTANSIMGAFDSEFLSPFESGIDDIAEYMKGSIQSGAKSSAEGALKAFQSSFVSPLKEQIAGLMSEVQKINISYNAKAASIYDEQTTNSVSGSQNYKATIGYNRRNGIKEKPVNLYISNYNNSVESSAHKVQDILQQILH